MPKVLVVSNTDLTPLLGGTVLWRQGVERVVTPATDAAFEIARAFVPSLVVVDGSDRAAALDLLRRLRGHTGTARSSLVVVAPDGGGDDELLRAGANLVLRGQPDAGAWDPHLEALLSVPRRVRLRFRVHVTPQGAEAPFVAEALDVSVRGLLIETSTRLALATSVDLAFALPGEPAELKATGTIVRAIDGSPGWLGIRFVLLAGDTAARLQALVSCVPSERTFGRYEPLSVVGEGSMGRVYRAFDAAAQRVVAIKTVRPEHMSAEDGAEYLRRFHREAQAAARLVHPNIVTIFDVADDFFVMELLEGTTLQALLRSRGRLAPAELSAVVDAVAAALDHAHAQGTIHGDVKPANIMITSDGRTKVMDFGLAHLRSAANSDPSLLLGSPAYMAPEQISSGRTTAGCDVFALAVTAYEALAGHRPFGGEEITPILWAIVHEEPRLPSSWEPSLSPFDAAFRRALAKDPEQRFATATAFAQAVAAVALPNAVAPATIPIVTPPEPPPSDPRAETLDLKDAAAASDGLSRRGWRRWMGVAAALVLAGIAATVGAWRLAVTPRPAPGLSISSEPDGATVWLDSTQVGRSPLVASRVSPGVHVVRLERDGFAPADLSVDVPVEGPPLPLRFTLRPTTGAIRVESEPPAAAVSVDGSAMGVTPLSTVRLPPGAHVVQVAADGYRPWLTTVDVKPGDTQDLVARLERGTGAAPGGRLRDLGWVHAGDLVPLGPGVTPPTRIKGDPAPYPAAARPLRLEGTVTVELTVTEKGDVADVRVVESAAELLDQALLRAAEGWRYEPGASNGVPVRVRIRQSQHFEPPAR